MRETHTHKHILIYTLPNMLIHTVEENDTTKKLVIAVATHTRIRKLSGRSRPDNNVKQIEYKSFCLELFFCKLLH